MLTTTPAAANPPQRRFAFVFGQNQGDPQDHPLKYAEADARTMLDVLTQVGDVPPENTLLLLGADAGQLQRSLDELYGRLQREDWGENDLLFVYVSGHAADGDLHLNGSHFPLRELRTFLARAPVGVALLVLDTCEAGAVMTAKGLRPLTGAAVNIDEGRLTGRVIITSSGAEESSLESEALRGSYFTHHFVAGLRGAADSSHDGQITLQEAYAYAYARTVESTMSAPSGLQTPAYDVKLRGVGDLVLTDPGRSRGRLRLAVDAPGEFLLVSLSGGAQVLRFVKEAGPVVFALEPGSYRLRRLGVRGDAETVITVPATGEALVSASDLSPPERGGGREKGGLTSSWEFGAAGGVGTGAVPGLGGMPWVGAKARRTTAVRFAGGQLAWGFDAAYQQGMAATAEGAFVEQELWLLGGVGTVWGWGRLRLGVLLVAGADLVWQQAGRAGTAFGAEPLAGIDAALSWTVTGLWLIGIRAIPAVSFVNDVSGRMIRGLVATGIETGLAF